ncbi:hypothetical protein [Janibacter sp. LM]|uniref:hypothetical protein n=1 Tax=Janibacter sp. LM TaxID=3144845 RepID=UPI0031F66F09
MGWAIGQDPHRRRHIGYGVPAACDHPDCDAAIDRGMSHACGGGVTGEADNCGLFFCEEHLAYEIEGEAVCERCANDQPPFEPSSDSAEWAQHVLTDDSWAPFREAEPAWTEHYRTLTTAQKD